MEFLAALFGIGKKKEEPDWGTLSEKWNPLDPDEDVNIPVGVQGAAGWQGGWQGYQGLAGNPGSQGWQGFPGSQGSQNGSQAAYWGDGSQSYSGGGWQGGSQGSDATYPQYGTYGGDGNIGGNQSYTGAGPSNLFRQIVGPVTLPSGKSIGETLRVGIGDIRYVLYWNGSQWAISSEEKPGKQVPLCGFGERVLDI